MDMRGTHATNSMRAELVVSSGNNLAGAMPSLAPACSREAVKLNRERGHVVLRESMPPRSAYYLASASFTFAVTLYGSVIEGGAEQWTVDPGGFRPHFCMFSISWRAMWNSTGLASSIG